MANVMASSHNGYAYKYVLQTDTIKKSDTTKTPKLTKGKKSTKEVPVKGEGKAFYSPEEVIIAYNEGLVALHSWIKVKLKNPSEVGSLLSATDYEKFVSEEGGN